MKGSYVNTNLVISSAFSIVAPATMLIDINCDLPQLWIYENVYFYLFNLTVNEITKANATFSKLKYREYALCT